jgi:hypothetical protein
MALLSMIHFADIRRAKRFLGNISFPPCISAKVQGAPNPITKEK